MNKIGLFLVSLLALFSCENTVLNPVLKEVDSTWLIPASEVKDGGVGRDGIPSIDNPTYSVAEKQEVLFDHELVTGVFVNGVAVAFPHKILDYHEIVNTQHGGFSYALTFCPLTGTSLVYPREIEGKVTTYGVSGLLYNSNLIIYDRESETLWSQMMLKGVRGKHIEKSKDFTQVIETTWKTWNSWYPNSLVLDPPNGKPRSYDIYAYGGYRTNHDLVLFPPAYDFTVYPRKERLLGVVIGKKMYYYRFNLFQNGVNFKPVRAGQNQLLIFADPEKNYMLAYSARTEKGKEIQVKEAFQDQQQAKLFEDTEGNIWSIFGIAIEGPLKGEKLLSYPNFIGFSFAMAAFYPNDFIDRSGI